MAFYLNRNFHRCLKRCLSTNVLNFSSNVNSKMITLEVDSMDEFTTQLMQKKINKWSARKNISKLSPDVKTEECSCDISRLNICKINTLFQEAIEENKNNQVLQLMQQCISSRLIPTTTNLLYTLSVCAQSGNISIIESIRNLYEDLQPEILEIHSNFQHYIAEATWNKGNVHKALILFKEVYKENAHLRRKIRLMIKNLVIGIIASRSEAVLISVIKFSEELAKEYQDYFPLSCIWQICFLSDWYSDQCVALDLLSKYEELRKTVINIIPYVVAVSLHNHKADAVYRLLETLLKFEMKLQYGGVLLSLLDYQIHQKNLRRCVEIIQWSVQNDVQLLPIQNKKFLKLLINNDDMTTILANIKPVKTVPSVVTRFKF